MGAGVFFIVGWSIGRIELLEEYTEYTRGEIAEAGWFRPGLDIDDVSLEKWSPVVDTKRQLELIRPQPTPGKIKLSNLHVLILCPLHNSEYDLPAYFKLLDRFATVHPPSHTSLGFLVSDTQDATVSLLRNLTSTRLPTYKHILVSQKDFNLALPPPHARHEVWAQYQRRAVMARSRSFLLSIALRPIHDYVLWFDSDVVQASPSLIHDLLRYGGADADVITANVFHPPRGGEMKPYDWNNWAETPESIEMRKKLASDELVTEASEEFPTFRKHLVEAHVPANISFYLPSSVPGLRSKESQTSSLYDKHSAAYVGKRMELDGVGGVATLVRADVHRFGAIFPSWLEQNSVETEGFGVLAKKVGAKVIGLPNYLVLHKDTRAPLD